MGRGPKFFCQGKPTVVGGVIRELAEFDVIVVFFAGHPGITSINP